MKTFDDLRNDLLQNGVASFDVKVIPRANKSGIAGFLDDGTLKVKLCAVPEKGKANAELCAIVAEWFAVSERTA